MDEKQNMLMPFKYQLRGMTKLDRSKFLKILKVPYVKLPCKSVGRVIGLKSIKDYCVKNRDGLKHTMNSSVAGEKFILFDPEALNSQVDDEEASVSKEDIRKIILEDMRKVLGEQAPTDFSYLEQSLTYDQWQARTCIRAILPPPLEFSSFSQVGHIAHLNLREELLPYKYIIGEIIHDKISWAKTVVNKLDMISNEFRFFDMELLAGEPNYVTELTENGIKYRMDFSKVFWNSRLSDVHESIVKQFNCNSVVFDVFCGVGPFVLPAIKHKKVKKVFANDLNPVPKGDINTYTMDGADFIRDVIAMEFAKFSREGVIEIAEFGPNFHVVMNLPSLSVSFLPYFKGFLSKYPMSGSLFDSAPFYIHCHLFVTATRDYEPKEWFANEAVRLVKQAVNQSDLRIQEVRHLRQVAGKKCMYCVSFKLPQGYAFSEEQLDEKHIYKDATQRAGQIESEETKASKRKLRDSVDSNEDLIEKISRVQ